ncbi:hypothetical protein HPULCUR_008263 [Helicostylum pulchrum]|uniref:Uncharacterized protein n=1 Tax=Helicostylum pulchrum TaxID=562976 RepID=A0ABP9Y7F3_9FUNG
MDLIKKLRDTEEEINQIEDGKSSAQAEDDNDDDDEVTSDLIKSFRNLDHSNKWILSNGKCVDNKLFLFTLQCREEHPSKQFIMDVADLTYVQYDVFTEEELDEISTVLYENELEADIGEPIRMTNQNRMNNKRTIDGFDTITRAKLGHKCDSVFRTCRINHSKDQEFRATEVKAKYNVSSEISKTLLLNYQQFLKTCLMI